MDKTYAVINDIQIPFEDRRVLRLVVSFIKDLAPNGVILNGDIVDCYNISDFVRSPINKSTISVERRIARQLLRDLQEIPEKTWLGGNHEDRLRRYLWKHAPGLFDVVDFPTLFGVSDYGFVYKPYGAFVKLGKLGVTHGNMVRRHSAMSGLAHLDRYGTSVLIGHTHRLGVSYRKDLRGVHAAFENGCLCKLSPEYVQHPNWQQGFSVVKLTNGGWFNVTQIPILPGPSFYYGDTLIKGAK